MKKKLGALFLAVMLGVNIFGTTTAEAATGDYVDKIFSFYVSSGNHNRETENYIKYNTSSVYVNLVDSSTGFAKVQTLAYIGGKWQNKTVGTTAKLNLGAQRVRNTIVEHGGSKTLTKLKFVYYITSTVNVGRWSPDCSTNSYPAAN